MTTNAPMIPTVLLPAKGPLLTRAGWSTFMMALIAVCAVAPVLNLWVPEGSMFHMSTYAVALLGKIMCYAICALAMDLIWGYTGILSLGHGVFFALGGYVMGMYLMRQIGRDGNYKSDLPDFMVFLDWKTLPWHWTFSDSFIATLFLIVLVPGVVAFVFGYFAFRSRIKGVYFSITTVEDLAVLKRVIVQNVSPTGYAVLNAADPIVAEMAAACPGKIIFFAADRHHPLMATHRAQDKRTVYIDGPMLVAAEGARVERIPLHGIPVTRGGAIAFQVENVMAAVAAAWAAGVNWETIKSGLASFVTNANNAPGRFNVMDYRGATVIADYGHNPDAMLALVAAVDAMPITPGQRRSVVISGAGDRRDSDITGQTAILGDAFDDVILYQDAAQRGRADGEVMALLREGLNNASRTSHIEEIRGEFLAIDTALARLNPGDLCLVLVDQVQEALDHLAAHVKQAKDKTAVH